MYSVSSSSANLERTFKVRSRMQNKTHVRRSDVRSDRKANIVFNSAQIHRIQDCVLKNKRFEGSSDMHVPVYDVYVTKGVSIVEGLAMKGQA